MYDSSLDNQHKATRKFARWFGPYIVTSVNDNATYHIAELDGTRIEVLVAGKQIKAFKKRYEDESDLDCVGEGDDPERTDEDGEVDRIFSHVLLPFLTHSRRCAGLVGVDVVRKASYMGKKGLPVVVSWCGVACIH